MTESEEQQLSDGNLHVEVIAEVTEVSEVSVDLSELSAAKKRAGKAAAVQKRFRIQTFET